jgi:nitronate monooxygenase
MAFMIKTKLTRRFSLTTPIALAPMALASGGELAAAWASAGALGLVGGGYGDLAWTKREYELAANRLATNSKGLARLGCGFISWKLDQDCSAFDWLLDQPVTPTAVMLSFGNPSKWALRLAAKGIPVICQIQQIGQLSEAVACGATAIVAQGSEAGGHGMNSREGRSTFTLVPEIADRLAALAPETVLLGAGGVSDGRGLAAMLMLGADGAIVGSRAWATAESLADRGALHAATAATGDDTTRSEIFDILRQKDWPHPFDFRALRNALHREWEGRESELRSSPDHAIKSFREAVHRGDFTKAHVTVGEGVGMINDIPSSADLIVRMTTEAVEHLSRFSGVD